jgi:hypothetical protein
MASINVVTGAVLGTIGSNAPFEWLNPNTTGGSCTVSNVGTWCTASSYSVPQAASASSPGKASATTLDVAGDFSFTSGCFGNYPVPRIHVGARPTPKPEHKK